MQYSVRDNPQRERYELHADDRIITVADYRRQADVITVHHVETDPEMRGQGMADRLMAAMLTDLRARNLSIRPLCPYAAMFIRQHPVHHDLVA